MLRVCNPSLSAGELAERKKKWTWSKRSILFFYGQRTQKQVQLEATKFWQLWRRRHTRKREYISWAFESRLERQHTHEPLRERFTPYYWLILLPFFLLNVLFKKKNTTLWVRESGAQALLLSTREKSASGGADCGRATASSKPKTKRFFTFLPPKVEPLSTFKSAFYIFSCYSHRNLRLLSRGYEGRKNVEPIKFGFFFLLEGVFLITFLVKKKVKDLLEKCKSNKSFIIGH